MTQANNGASSNGKDESSKASEVYENLDADSWIKVDTESGESELLFSSQLPEEIKPENTDESEDDSPNPKRN